VSKALRPGIASGAYPERERPHQSWLDGVANGLLDRLGRGGLSLGQLRRVAETVEARGSDWRDTSDEALARKRVQIRRRLQQEGIDGNGALDAFALVGEVARRVLGMQPFDVQVMGGYAMLRGLLAEMQTGEGKTLTATLPACTAALAGIPVHVITVNDYLVERDADLMRPLYEALGLRVGTVLDRNLDPRSRREAYACDVTYVTNKQLAFDYLRDRMVRGDRNARLVGRVQSLFGAPQQGPGLLLRGLCFAVVDEADSVLIDEARTPLILSRPADTSDLAETCRVALELAAELREGSDFTLQARERQVGLTEEGCQQIETLSSGWGGAWARRQSREQLVRQALSAEHLFLRDTEYLVRDGKVQIIDANTGRVMKERSWEAGLHQMIEVKEGCAVTSQKETLARISYQQFFRRYLRLSGMTGTVREVSREICAIYRLQSVTIPTHRPTQRKAWPERAFENEERKWDAIVARIDDLHCEGRPVLIGTGSVAASERLSERLQQRGLAHAVLNARQDRQEAEIIARAGERGRITVATNMAGRGSDIRLGVGAEALGGLHVIASERSEARRIDRQLFGRCGRQGEPGSYERMSSLEDAIPTEQLPAPLTQLTLRVAARSQGLGCRLALWIGICGQRAAERRHARLRRELAKLEEYYDRALAFAGPGE